MNPTILLLGCGYTLSRLAEILPQGMTIATASREESCAALSARAIPVLQVDLRDSGALADAVARFPTLHTIIDSVPPLGGRPGSSDQDPLRGSREVARAIAAAPSLTRLISLSTTGVYGGRDGEWVDESSPLNAFEPRSIARVAVEEFYRTLPIATTIFRISGIYGSDRNMLHSLRRGDLFLVNGGTRWSNRIHVDDLVEALRRAVLSTAPLPPVLNVSDDVPAPLSEVVHYLSSKYGLPPPPSVTEEEAREKRAFTFLTNQRVSNALLKRTFNLALKYPSYREGLVE
jgi:nucleoside-diphosphate-sugar epimerase